MATGGFESLAEGPASICGAPAPGGGNTTTTTTTTTMTTTTTATTTTTTTMTTTTTATTTNNYNPPIRLYHNGPLDGTEALQWQLYAG